MNKFKLSIMAVCLLSILPQFISAEAQIVLDIDGTVAAAANRAGNKDLKGAFALVQDQINKVVAALQAKSNDVTVASLQKLLGARDKIAQYMQQAQNSSWLPTMKKAAIVAGVLAAAGGAYLYDQKYREGKGTAAVRESAAGAVQATADFGRGVYSRASDAGRAIKGATYDRLPSWKKAPEDRSADAFASRAEVEGLARQALVHPVEQTPKNFKENIAGKSPVQVLEYIGSFN